MPIHYTDQLNLLKDILERQLSGSRGSVSECEQIERLVKSLLANHVLDQRTKDILTDIYEYGQKGKYTQKLDEHIENHQDQLVQWVNEIGQFS